MLNIYELPFSQNKFPCICTKPQEKDITQFHFSMRIWSLLRYNTIHQKLPIALWICKVKVTCYLSYTVH